MGGLVILLLVLLNAIVLRYGMAANPLWYKAIYITLPLLVIALFMSRSRQL